MKCPACTNPLTERTVGGITVDVCENGCGGIWFDRFELAKMDEPHESAGEPLLEVVRDETVVVDHSRRRMCPKCANTVMMRHFFSVKKSVEVDECPQCGGFWLDAGELARIRSDFRTEEERHRAADAYFQHVFGEELARLAADSRAQREKAKRIAQMFRFLCPSYYIPGKQSWGAF